MGEERESSCTQRSRRESELSAGTDFSPNSQTLYSLKLPRNPHAMLIYIGHGLHPRVCCFSFVTTYTHAMLILCWSQHTPMHSLFLEIILLILSTAGCICQRHLSGSSHVNIIYYTNK